MNPGHPLTPSLYPSEGERVLGERVRGVTGAMRGFVPGSLTPPSPLPKGKGKSRSLP